MYLLEIELLRQENLFRQHQGRRSFCGEGDYYLESSGAKYPLQQLAREYWIYQEQPSYQSRTSSSTLEADSESCFQQQIKASAGQLVTTLAQAPETIAQILKSLEQELPETLPLGLVTTGNDILNIIECQGAFADLVLTVDKINKGKLR